MNMHHYHHYQAYFIVLVTRITLGNCPPEHASLGSRDSAIVFAGDPNEIYQQNPLAEKALMPEDPSIALAVPLAETRQRDREACMWYPYGIVTQHMVLSHSTHTCIFKTGKCESQVNPMVLCERKASHCS